MARPKSPPPQHTGVRGVYALVDPRDGHVAYVGSSEDIGKRGRDHFTSGSGSGTRKRFVEFNLPLRALGLEPLVVVLEEIPHGEMRDSEFEWIATYRLVGEAEFNWQVKRSPLTAERNENARLRARIAELEALLEQR